MGSDFQKSRWPGGRFRQARRSCRRVAEDGLRVRGSRFRDPRASAGESDPQSVQTEGGCCHHQQVVLLN